VNITELGLLLLHKNRDLLNNTFLCQLLYIIGYFNLSSTLKSSKNNSHPFVKIVFVSNPINLNIPEF